MSQCSPCSSRYTFTVNVEADGADLSATLSADQCCRLSTRKAIKSVLLNALCQHLTATTSLATDDPVFYNNMMDVKKRCQAFNGLRLALTPSGANVYTTLANTITSQGTSAYFVTPPYTEINT